MEKTKQQKAKDFIINNGVIIVMFILVIYTGLTSDNFLTRNNLMNILMNMSSRLVIALGIAGCVITAGCDLSAGRMIGFAACIAGTLLQRIDYSGKFFPDMQPMNVFLALIVVMAICAAFGSITGFFIAYLSVPPFIATLAMMEIVYGISLIYTTWWLCKILHRHRKRQIPWNQLADLDRNFSSSYHMVHLQHDTSWKIYVCNRW